MYIQGYHSISYTPMDTIDVIVTKIGLHNYMLKGHKSEGRRARVTLWLSVWHGVMHHRVGPLQTGLY